MAPRDLGIRLSNHPSTKERERGRERERERERRQSQIENPISFVSS
jgi:hypothetical protein